MATVTFILGYCASGKSHLADEMEKTLGVKKFDEGFLNDGTQHMQLIEALRNNIDCVVIEIEYCLGKPRESIVEELKKGVPGVTIKWECLEADLQIANENCWRGNHKGNPAGHVWINTHRIGSNYKIPAGVIPRKIYQIPKPGA